MDEGPDSSVQPSGPLPLVEWARPCVQCGWCCKQSSCGAARYDHEKKQCAALVDNEDGTYSCGKYNEILEMSRHMWETSPAFGSGCCSSMNSDRQKILKERHEALHEIADAQG